MSVLEHKTVWRAASVKHLGAVAGRSGESAVGRYADTSGYSEEENELWEQLIENQDRVFKTARGLEFRYRIVGNEMFVERKEKSITRSTVNMAYRKAVELRVVTGPKKLGVFGASYLYPVFVELGICREGK